MERKTAIGLLLFVLLTYGGMIAYQFKTDQKSATPEPTQEENWKWDNDWDKGAEKEDPETTETEDKSVKNDTQIIAKDYAEALQKSAETNKPIMINFSAEWCHWCKKMDEETLADPAVVELLKNYIVLKVDTDKDKTLTTKFGIPSLPSYVITNTKEEKLDFANGFMKVETFSAWLKNPKIMVLPKTEKKVDPVVPDRKDDRKKSRRLRSAPTPNNPQMESDVGKRRL